MFYQEIKVPFSVIFDYYWEVIYLPTPGLVFATLSL